MALRTFQFCIVFTIGGILINSTVLSNTTTESPASTPSLESPPLSVRLERPSQYVRVVPRGQSVYFDCPATPGPGTAPSSVVYQWYLNDKLINSNTPHYKQYGNGTLFISKISGKKIFQNLTFEGDYRCHLTNNVGTVIAEAITLKLPMLSRSFIEQPNNMTVEVGDYAIFNCRITSVPEAIISWEHNSIPLTSKRFSSKYFQLPSGSLVISQVQRIEDEGSYRCTATNRIQKKSRTSVAGYLTVIPVQNKPRKPHLVPHNLTTHLIVNVKEDVHFYCFANGYPKPFIRWEVPFNSTVNKTVALNSSYISITNITADIPRNYTCTAQNSLGFESQTWTISLRPYFTEKPISKRVPPARTVRLNCTASGWPEPKITWLKDGEPLGEALNNGQIISKYGRITIKSDNMLVIADTITNDSGLYQCVASNSVGEIRSVARVLVASLFNKRLPPPSPPSGVTCRSYTSNSVCLQWNSQPLNATKIEAYTVHYRSKDGTDKEQQHATNETYSLVELSLPNTQYLFYLRAYIRSAASEQSEPIVCQGGELTKRNITLEAESPEILNIQWTPLFNDTPCGEIPQYKVQWRRYKHASNSAKLVKFADIFTNSNSYKYQITDLVPSHTYEVRVLTLFQDESIPWLTFTMPNLTTFINQTKSSSSISHLEAVPTSPNSINLTWQTSLNENFNDFGYYNICYTEAISLETCEENGTYIKSRTNSIEIKNLKPYTLYKFQVRSHDLNDNYGNFSNLVECFTKEGLPSPVRGLTSKYVNATTKTIEWQAPAQINGVLRNYSLYYYVKQCSIIETTINSKHCDNAMLPSYNKWNSIVIAPNKYRVELINLKPGAQYNVTIFAETGAGRSRPVSIITQLIPTIYQIGTQDSHGERKPNTDPNQSQTIGIIIGCSIAGLCITLCITYMMWYRRCLKSTLNARHHNNGLRTFNAPTNGHNHQSQHHIVQNNLDSSSISIVRRSATPAITTTTGITDNESSESTSIPLTVNVSLSERGELHEMQSLVHSTDTSLLPPHIPPVVQTHLDTKGGASFPNGHINGFKFPLNNGRLANGIVRITENPQYNIDTEYDTRSAGSNNNSRETNCNFEEDHHLLQSPHGRHHHHHEEEDDEDDTFNQHHNSTQLTNLDNSLLTNSISSTPRRISPILGPNG